MTKTLIISSLLSILPISELRGAIPYAYFNGINLFASFAFCVLCNCLVAPIGFVFLNTAHKALDKWSFYHKLFEKTVAKARVRVGEKVEKYGLWGLMVFVAVPLPITGAWTGTIGAWILGLNKKKSTLSICLGVLIAGIVVSSIIYAGVGINSIFIKQV